MPLKYRSFFLVLVAVSGVVLTFSYSKPSKTPRIENRANLPPLHLKRIAIFVGKLKKESLADSLKAQSADYEAFANPGYDSREVDQPDEQFLKMLSSRRSIKLMQDLQFLSSEEQQDVLSATFNAMLGDQKKAVFSMIDNPNPAKATKEYYARRYGIAWVMFSTAEFGSNIELLRQVDELDRLRQIIEEKCHRIGTIHNVIVDYFVTDPFPDDVAVLNIMLHYLLKNSTFKVALLNLRRRYLPLMKFDSPANTFDLYMVPTDEQMLPICMDKVDVWKEVSVFKWEGELGQPENVQAVIGENARPSFNHRKTRLALVRSLLTGINPQVK